MAKSEMRKALKETLEKMMREDDKVMVLDADLASANATLSLRKEFKDRAIDIGISEAHMASMAAGLSSEGFKPWCVTFTAFATRRLCDQAAISCAYAKQNVKIVGTDSGVTAQTNGGTHMSFEDIGIMRSIPEITVLEPADKNQLVQIMEQIKDEKGVFYIRMERKDAEDIFEDDYKLNLYKADVIREGSDVTIVASGAMVNEAKKAALELENEGIKAEILVIHSYKPIDTEALVKSAKKTNLLVVLDNHNIHGGLYSSVTEALSPVFPVKTLPIGINNHFGEVGKTAYLMEKYGIDSKSIAKKTKDFVHENKNK